MLAALCGCKAHCTENLTVQMNLKFEKVEFTRNSYQDILLSPTNVSLLVALEE